MLMLLQKRPFLLSMGSAICDRLGSAICDRLEEAISIIISIIIISIIIITIIIITIRQRCIHYSS